MTFMKNVNGDLKGALKTDTAKDNLSKSEFKY